MAYLDNNGLSHLWSKIVNLFNKKIEVSETAPTEEENKIWLQPLTTNAGAVDYIVDEGVSGIWTYRKWNNGIAECWGFWQEEGIAIKEPSSGAYTSNSMTKTLPFVFYDTSIIAGHVSRSMWFGNTWVSSGTSTLNYAISRTTSADSDSCDVRMFIIGKWK